MAAAYFFYLSLTAWGSRLIVRVGGVEAGEHLYVRLRNVDHHLRF
jgi:hypothetical protein